MSTEWGLKHFEKLRGHNWQPEAGPENVKMPTRKSALTTYLDANSGHYLQGFRYPPSSPRGGGVDLVVGGVESLLRVGRDFSCGGSANRGAKKKQF